jgi:GntR family transcriptional regulator
MRDGKAHAPKRKAGGTSFVRPAARYATLAQALLEDIQAGRYSVGSQLPTEAELQARYDVSRHTVRQALRELKDLGVISSHPGIGTLVRARGYTPNFVHDASTVEDLLQLTKQTRMKVLSSQHVIADAALAAFLPCGEGQQWLTLVMLRFLPRHTIPIAHLRIYMRPEFSSIVAKIERTHLPLFRMIEQDHGQKLREIRQEITAIALDAEEAAALEAAPGSHALQVLRRYYNDQGRLTQVAVAKYPGGRFTHTSTFRLRPMSGDT